MLPGNLAVFSPSSNAYSETFIQSHRKLNSGRVSFYYGGLGELKLDGFGRIQSHFKKAFWRLSGKAFGRYKYDITRSLKKSFKKNDIQAVLIEYGNFATELLPYLDFFDGKIIVHFHGYDASVYALLESYREGYKKMFARVDRIVVVSKKMKEMLLDMGAPLSKIVLNTYGPHEDFQKIIPDYNSSRLLSVGRFVDKKAPHYLVLIMKELVKEIPDLKLVIVGEGVLFQTVRDLILYYCLENNVELKGRQSREEIMFLMSSTCCYVQHSVRALDGDMEGTPNSILEASAAGLPVISTFHAGIPDVIEPGVTGFLVDEHDVAGMVDALKSVLNDRGLLKKMGESGKQKISDEFTQSKYLNLLDKILIENE